MDRYLDATDWYFAQYEKQMEQDEHIYEMARETVENGDFGFQLSQSAPCVDDAFYNFGGGDEECHWLDRIKIAAMQGNDSEVLAVAGEIREKMTEFIAQKISEKYHIICQEIADDRAEY